jgi:signal transduction histidine kinase
MGLVLGCGLLHPAAARAAGWIDAMARVASPEFRALDDRRAELGREPAGLRLAAGSPNSLGYHSGVAGAADQARWVEVDLGGPWPVDTVVVFPAASPPLYPSPGFFFPKRFRVELTALGDWSAPVTVADYTLADYPFPVDRPVVLPARGVLARKVRFTATRLVEQDGWHCLSLAELVVVSGKRNVAAGRPVSAFDSCETGDYWGARALVDGQSPFGLPLGTNRTGSFGYSCRPRRRATEAAWVQVDLGAVKPIDEVRLVPARPPDLPGRGGVGFPQHYRVEAAATPDFSDPVVLRDATTTRVPNPGDGLVVIPANGPVSGRYVRVTATELWRRDRDDHIFALAELQVSSGGDNAARGAPVAASDSVEDGGWSAAALTDGFASEYELLDWPEWAERVARGTERDVRARAIEAAWDAARIAAYDRVIAGAVAACGAVALIAVGLAARSRLARRREAERLRFRIARDLHDEVGSNLGSIILLGRSAWRDDPAQTREDLREVTRIAEETAASLRDLVWLLNRPGGADRDFPTRLREAVAGLTTGLKVTFHVPPAAALADLPLTVQRTLLLAFKEMVHNAVRHSGTATLAATLRRVDGVVSLEVTDEGRGFDPGAATDGSGLAGIRARAAAAGGRADVRSEPGRGTTVRLSVPDGGRT